MANWNRSGAQLTATIPGSADRVWELLTDWAGIMRWLPEDKGPIAVVASELIGTHGEVPRTRRIHVEGGLVIDEPLLWQDDEARRIYYQVESGAIPGLRNYFATTTVDDLGDGTSRIAFSSHYDVAPGADVAAMREMFEAVYDTVARGFTQYIAKNRR